MRPRVERHVAYLDGLIGHLERHMQTRLIAEVNVDDTEAIAAALAADDGRELTLAGLARRIEAQQGSQPIDAAWLKRMNSLVAGLKELRWRYREGTRAGRGRSSMGLLNSTVSSVWGSTWPFNPYPFPWANHLFQDSPSLAMGVFEGHMAKMAAGFRAWCAAPSSSSRAATSPPSTRSSWPARLAAVQRRGVRAVSAGGRAGRRRGDVRTSASRTCPAR